MNNYLENKKMEKLATSPFDRVVDSLRSKGIDVQFIPEDSQESAEYNPVAKIVRVRKDNMNELAEEAFHVRQNEMAEKFGIEQKDNLDAVVIAGGELEIINRKISILKRKMQNKKELFMREQIEAGKSYEEVFEILTRRRWDEEHEISLETNRMYLYTEKLHRLLEALSVNEREKYKALFKNSLFVATQQVMDWIDQGIRSEEMWGLVSK